MTLKTVLDDLRKFVEDEQKASYEQMFEVCENPIEEKLENGESQAVHYVERLDKDYLTLKLGDNESRLREGDMICLHLGDPMKKRFVGQASIEIEYDGEWLVRVSAVDDEALATIESGCYADPDTMDLKIFYDKALNEISETRIGREVVLPLLSDELNASFIYEDNYDEAADRAEAAGFNEDQVDAVAKGVAARYLACIQGPPGTGKTKVISLIAKLLVEEGQRVLLPSHTHMAINNALNKVAEQQVPVVKVGTESRTKGLDKSIQQVENASSWKNMPDSGYVIGATPFATCTARLDNFQFDTVIFDEASQITLPLALMAMRTAKRFVFVGDHKQLPPVVLSRSVLGDYSVFSRLISANPETSVMLSQTYRMCRDLARWPSDHYYQKKLVSTGLNANKSFELPKMPHTYVDVLSGAHPFVFIRSPGISKKHDNPDEAKLVVDIVSNAMAAGLISDDIGVVTPFRSHAKALKVRLMRQGLFSRGPILTDTVERMQGQEREVIIISLCATDPQYIAAIAEFFFKPERLNVAITRPKTKLIMIGPVLEPSFGQELSDKKVVASINDYRSLVSAAYRVKQEAF